MPKKTSEILLKAINNEAECEKIRMEAEKQLNRPESEDMAEAIDFFEHKRTYDWLIHPDDAFYLAKAYKEYLCEHKKWNDTFQEYYEELEAGYQAAFRMAMKGRKNE